MAKPTNKIQRKIIAMSKALPKITKAQKADCFTMHKKYVRLRYTTKNHCLHCGHEWNENNLCAKLNNGTDCPKCRQWLCSIDAPSNTPFNYQAWWVDKKVYGIVTTHEGYQVVRVFMSEVDMAKGRKSKHSTRQLAQHWIDDKGKVKSIYVGNSGSFYNITWGYGDLEFRGGSTASFKYGEEPHKYWKVKRVIPMLRRNGMKSGIHNINAQKLFRALLTEPKIETLFKAKYYGLVAAHIYGQIDVNDTWGSIKIALRNNYDPVRWNDWKDLLGFLEYCGKDIRNAKYICPANLKEAHDFWMHRQRLLIDREGEIRRVKNDKRDKILGGLKNNKQRTVFYQKEKGDLLGLIFTDGEIVIEPLKTVQEFLKAGEKLDHCVGTSAYYEREDSLVLSAKCKKELMETIEVSLKDFSILQARGYDNVESKYNAKIRTLVKRNMNQIRKMA